MALACTVAGAGGEVTVLAVLLLAIADVLFWQTSG